MVIRKLTYLLLFQYGCKPWDLQKETCQGILNILDEYQWQVSVAGGEGPISDYAEKSVVNDGAEPEEERGVKEGGKEQLATRKNIKIVTAARTEKEKSIGQKMAPLHTKSVLAFGVSFLHGEFVPRLVKKMPRLQHISIIIRVRQFYYIYHV